MIILQIMLQFTFPDDFLDSLFDSKLLSFLWKLVDDNESYVRATCISAIGFLAMHDRIWKHFQEILTLTEVYIKKVKSFISLTSTLMMDRFNLCFT